MTTGAFVNNGMIGVKVDATGVTTPEWQIGTRAKLSDGSEWIYIKASATALIYDALAIIDNATCQPITSTLGLRGVAVGIAQQALTSGSHYWVLTSNPTPPSAPAGVPDSTDNYKVKVLASCAVDAKLATTSTAGVLDDTTAGSVLRLDGIVLTDTNTASVSSARTFRTAIGGISWGAV
jgi:hypothetical protein